MVVSILKSAVVMIFLSLMICFFRAESAAKDGGFSGALIHRDSPLSPFYNPYQTDIDRLRNALSRSNSLNLRNINYFKSSTPSAAVSTPLVLDDWGEYMMNVSVGTPPVQVLGMVDTILGTISVRGYHQIQTPSTPIHVYDPTQSSSFGNVTCDSSYCQYFVSECESQSSVCGYTDLNSIAIVGVDKFTTGSVSLPSIYFLYESLDSATVDDQVSLFSLSTHPLSLISQLKDTSIPAKFSYCLVPITTPSNVTSKINFGTEALVSSNDHNVVSISLIERKFPETGYFVQLEAISVGKKRIPYNVTATDTGMTGAADQKRNMAIVFETLLTSLDEEIFDKFATSLEESIGSQRQPDPDDNFDACFISKLSDSDLPVITLHFSGADLKLQPSNAFSRLQEDLVCSNFMPSQLAMLGSFSQMNFLVGYDIEEMTVSFMPTDCTKQ